MLLHVCRVDRYFRKERRAEAEAVPETLVCTFYDLRFGVASTGRTREVRAEISPLERLSSGIVEISVCDRV